MTSCSPAIAATSAAITSGASSAFPRPCAARWRPPARACRAIGIRRCSTRCGSRRAFSPPPDCRSRRATARTWKCSTKAPRPSSRGAGGARTAIRSRRPSRMRRATTTSRGCCWSMRPRNCPTTCCC